jgi:hypothetical protein
MYFSARDQDGDPLGFTAYFDIYHYTGGSWVYLSTHGCPSDGNSGSTTLVQGDSYQARGEDYSGYTTPDDQTKTACTQDFSLVWEEEISEGDILSGDVQPTSQEEGSNCDFAVTIKNIGNASGHFTLKYYEGASLLRSTSAGTLTAGQQVDDVAEIFVMPDHDFTIQVRMYNDTEGTTDDTYDITCYLATNDWYVKTTGDDAKTGTSWAQAWKTINKAATTVADGSTVHIGFGNYVNEPATNKIAPQNIGASGIYYLPETAETGGGTGTVSVEQN